MKDQRPGFTISSGSVPRQWLLSGSKPVMETVQAHSLESVARIVRVLAKSFTFR
jgi:hypothetical protein